MFVIFVHGWSVQSTDTYGDLPGCLPIQGQGLKIEVANIYLGRYISFIDTVTVDDLARAFDQAWRDEIGAKVKAGERFACITHSTGGPVVRKWMGLYYKDKLDKCPLSHLVMLAPANHGSALARLGKGTLSRLKSSFGGVEPGQRILDWLELGSSESWELNESWLDYDCPAHGVYPFVLTGQKIDRGFVDVLNNYTAEAGSDGVVRVAAANMNYSLLRLRQVRGKSGQLDLERVKLRPSSRTAFGVLPGRSHSGDNIGIIRSVTMANAAEHPTVKWVVNCLAVKTLRAYNSVSKDLKALTAATQKAELTETESHWYGKKTYTTNRYSMVIFKFVDDRGNNLSEYELFLTAGPKYDENALPEGFSKDRQRNQRNPGQLTYYLNYDVLTDGLHNKAMGGKLGFRVNARPEKNTALAYYVPLNFEGKLANVDKILLPNETLMVEITLLRQVDKTVFRITNSLEKSRIEAKPSGQEVE
jgi:hypothetical protein